MHSSQVIDHFQQPRNAGILPDATVTVTAENPACGDVLQLAVLIVNGAIREVRFKSQGCTASIACGSVLTELIAGKTLVEARQLQRQQIVDALGGLSNETMHASHLAMDALYKALKQVAET